MIETTLNTFGTVGSIHFLKDHVQTHDPKLVNKISEPISSFNIRTIFNNGAMSNQ